MDEVAPLLAVLEDRGAVACGEAGGEVGEHPGVGVGERLARAEDVEEPERDRLNLVGLPEDEDLTLLSVFG